MMNRLLGWSAFVGALVLVISWPLNNFIAEHAIKIQKGTSAAKDKRMGVLNELITAVCGPVLSKRNIHRVLMVICTDKVRQIFCMGRSMD